MNKNFLLSMTKGSPNKSKQVTKQLSSRRERRLSREYCKNLQYFDFEEQKPFHKKRKEYHCESRVRHWRKLENFLHSREGQPWDDVLSEVVQAAGPRSRKYKHVLKELYEVESERLEQWKGLSFGYERNDFYVDSEGILRKNTPKNKPHYPVEYSQVSEEKVEQLVEYREPERYSYQIKLGNITYIRYGWREASFGKKIHMQGSKLFWCYPTGWSSYIQKDELSPADYALFGLMSERQRQRCLYNPNKAKQMLKKNPDLWVDYHKKYDQAKWDKYALEVKSNHSRRGLVRRICLPRVLKNPSGGYKVYWI